MPFEKIIQNRVLQNVLFWVFFAVVPFAMNLGHFGSPANMYTDIQYYVECAFIGYVNNLLLMPKLFDKKKYFSYALSFIFLLVFITWLSGQITVVLSPNYPQNLLGAIYEAIDYFIFLVAFGCGHLVRSYIQQSKDISRLEEDKLSTEIDFLKSQINPHLLFNTLNTIYSYSLNQVSETPKMILKLSEIMRYMLYETNEDKVTLKKELDYIEDYVSLQKLRVKNRGEVIFNVSGDVANQSIAPMLLISFIENAFKHSMDSMASGIEIQIAIEVNVHSLKLCVINNYESNALESKVGGIGMKNVAKRLELLYPNQHKLGVEDSGQSYKIELYITL